MIPSSMVMHLDPKKGYKRLILKPSSKYARKLRIMVYILKQISNRLDYIQYLDTHSI